jgi:hypothetical protein
MVPGTDEEYCQHLEKTSGTPWSPVRITLAVHFPFEYPRHPQYHLGNRESALATATRWPGTFD